MEHSTLELIAIILGPGGAVYVGLKAALNGMKTDMRDIKSDVKEIRDYTIRQGGLE